jgi:hypothetical protein
VRWFDWLLLLVPITILLIALALLGVVFVFGPKEPALPPGICRTMLVGITSRGDVALTPVTYPCPEGEK